MWIINWSLLDEKMMYIVCPINVRDDKSLYLGQPKTAVGWQIKQSYIEGCYAALESPPLPFNMRLDMACPTCSHTMTPLGCRVTDKTFFWCPRCGTIKPCEGAEVTAPDLVRRCRQFEKTFPPGNPSSVSYSQEWNRIGIAESINVPENRHDAIGRHSE